MKNKILKILPLAITAAFSFAGIAHAAVSYSTSTQTFTGTGMGVSDLGSASPMNVYIFSNSGTNIEGDAASTGRQFSHANGTYSFSKTLSDFGISSLPAGNYQAAFIDTVTSMDANCGGSIDLDTCSNNIFGTPIPTTNGSQLVPFSIPAAPASPCAQTAGIQINATDTICVFQNGAQSLKQNGIAVLNNSIIYIMAALAAFAVIIVVWKGINLMEP